MIKPGPSNHIIDVRGILVGHAQDEQLMSGVTVVLPDQPAVAAVDCRGGGPGTRETDALRSENLVEHVHAIVLSGGSAPGLEAACGVSDWLQDKDRGFKVSENRVVPIVPAAVLFDLKNDKDKLILPRHRYYDFGITAASKAGMDYRLGNVGAGTGAKAGTLKGGLGSVSLQDDRGFMVGALVAVNSFGSVTLPERPEFWAWPFERNAEYGGLPPPRLKNPLSIDYEHPNIFGEMAHTTLGVVAINASLSRSQALRLAIMAQDGISRSIRPVHTPFDGDTIFLLATGEKVLKETVPLELSRLGMMTADCVARAIARGVYEAENLGPWPSYRSQFKFDGS